LFKLFMQLQIFIFRRTQGRLMASMRGMPVLLLNTVGRKTGKPRTTPLMYIRDGDDYVITASNGGADKHPAWFYNLEASPQVEIEVPGKRLPVLASKATPAEHDRLWAQLVTRAPSFDGYQKGTTRPIPMIVLRPR
jgi:deazaflavin-dependent oxidoreductase (nitroreductase family)